MSKQVGFCTSCGYKHFLPLCGRSAPTSSHSPEWTEAHQALYDKLEAIDPDNLALPPVRNPLRELENTDPGRAGRLRTYAKRVLDNVDKTNAEHAAKKEAKREAEARLEAGERQRFDGEQQLANYHRGWADFMRGKR